MTYQPLCKNVPKGVCNGECNYTPPYAYFEPSNYNKPLSPVECGDGWWSRIFGRKERCERERVGPRCRKVRWQWPVSIESDSCNEGSCKGGGKCKDSCRGDRESRRGCKDSCGKCNECRRGCGLAGLFHGDEGCHGGAPACQPKSKVNLDKIPVLPPTQFRKYAPCDDSDHPEVIAPNAAPTLPPPEAKPTDDKKLDVPVEKIDPPK